jgi:hypothetical protein
LTNSTDAVLAQTKCAQLPLGDGGSNLTTPLHLYQFAPCVGELVVPIIVKEHYSHSMSGVQYRNCFKATLNDIIIGAAIFGQTAMPATWKKYAVRYEDLHLPTSMIASHFV